MMEKMRMVRIMMRLRSDISIMRVRLKFALTGGKLVCGEVIGSYDGVCGVLMDNGEYRDIPARDLDVMRLE